MNTADVTNSSLHVVDSSVVRAINRLAWVTGVGLGLVVLILWWAV